MEFKDYYDTLGVARTASEADIRNAYRRLARKYHPDRNKDPGAEDRFKAVGEAYEVLKDKDKRAAYDRLGASGYRPGDQFRPPPDWGDNAHFEFGDLGGDGRFSDFFESLFGRAAQRGHAPPRARRGADAKARIGIDLATAYAGGPARVALLDPDGSERTLEVRIPRGIESGKTIRLGGQGQPGHGGAPAGDLLLEVEIRDSAEFRLRGRDVESTLRIAPWEAAFGARLDVPTLGGSVQMQIPAGSQSGRKLRLKGRGLPGNPPGNQLVTLEIVVPEAGSDDERKAWEAFRDAFQEFEPRS